MSLLSYDDKETLLNMITILSKSLKCIGDGLSEVAAAIQNQNRITQINEQTMSVLLSTLDKLNSEGPESVSKESVKS